MFHARETAAFAHRLIERIAGRGRAEGFAIAAAEALDRFLVQQRFGGGEQGEAVDAAGGALVGGVEAADGFNLVAEKVEAERLLLAAREQIDNAAANGELAAIMHGVGADIAIALEHGGQPCDRDPLLGREMGDQLAHAKGGERPLRHGVVTTNCGALGAACSA